MPNARIHGNRSQAARTDALAGFKAGRYQVLVATDIVARGIDVEALEHVVNFDVPHVPEDYIHRVGRTARAEATGDAFTFVSPDEERDLAAIERAIGKQLPRITVEGFDYRAKPAERFEVPDRRAHRGDPQAQGGGARPRQGEGGAQGAAGGRGGDPHPREVAPFVAGGPPAPRKGRSPRAHGSRAHQPSAAARR